jgi:single-stranded-DNA-specific exonuclease
MQVDNVVSNDDVFKTLLSNRKIYDYLTFFSMGREKFINPYHLNDMAKAVRRINEAVNCKEKILIFGDYDCDGISSIALLYKALSKIGALVSYDLPDRFIEGYGLNDRAINDIISKNYHLVITVDNGISCLNEIDNLNNHGIDTIITDHHQPGLKIPNAFAIIHPLLSKDYPFKDIAGVMVAFKLAHALLDGDVSDLYDLAMIGTIADLMPLEGENQAMVNEGLNALKATKHVGLKKLLEYSSLDIINVTAIAFKIAPKINSSGRLNKAKEAVELLITEDIKRANELIIDIEKNHDLRKKLTEDAFLICEESVNPEDSILVVASEKLHEGVIGICAQRLVEKYQKSTIVITKDEEGIGKGSARAFGEQNILELLQQQQELLIRFGGHSQAAGLQLDFAMVDRLRENLNQVDIVGKPPILKVDMEVYLPNLKIHTIKEIQDKSFFTATYVMKNLKVIKKQLLKDKHTKLTLEIDGYFYDALDFNSQEFYYRLNQNDVIDICGGLTVNSYRKKDNLQILIKDLKCNDLQVFKLEDIDELYFEQTEYLFVNDSFIIESDSFDEQIKQKRSIVMCPRKKEYNMNLIIDKMELGKIYRNLEKIKEFTLDDVWDKHANKAIIKILEIFKEINLIKQSEDRFFVEKVSTKMNLNDSKTYCDMVDKYKLIEQIYKSSKYEVDNFFKRILEE